MNRKGSALGLYIAAFSIIIFAIAAPLFGLVFDAVLPSYTSDITWIAMITVPAIFIIIALKGVFS